MPIAKDRPETINGGFLQGGGRQAGPQVRVKPDELTAPPEEAPERVKKGRKTKLAAFGLSPMVLKRGDPEYAACLDQANKYRMMRMKEISKLHGIVTSGAGAMLASASLALAASRFLYQRAASTGDSGTLQAASKLADSARQHELAAWEMSAKEGVLTRRQAAAEQGMPWLMKNDGNPKLHTGRRPNVERLRAEADVAVPILDAAEEDNHE